MKKLLLTSLYMFAVTVSNMAYGLGSDNPGSGVSVDAIVALQATQLMIYADLEKNMRTNLCSMPRKYAEDFGVDDINSYTQKKLMTISRPGIEG